MIARISNRLFSKYGLFHLRFQTLRNSSTMSHYASKYSNRHAESNRRRLSDHDRKNDVTSYVRKRKTDDERDYGTQEKRIRTSHKDRDKEKPYEHDENNKSSSYYKSRYEKQGEGSRMQQSTSSVTRRSLSKEIKNILDTEKHHIVKIYRNKDDDVEDVKWCPKYLTPSKSFRRAPGGRALLHHRCRSCGRTCLHLLGKYGSSDRKCLACSAEQYGWEIRRIPKWYYHDRKCDNCRY